jgi:hypothetical protein
MKLTLMVRFKKAGKKHFDRKPAAYGKSGRVKSGWVEFKDPKTRELVRFEVDNCTYDIRVEDKGTNYIPAGKNAVEAEAKRLRMLSKAIGRDAAEKAGLEVIDPEAEASKRVLLVDEFDEYIEDAQKRNALEAKEQAVLVAKEFLVAVKIKFVDEVNREKILEFDEALRAVGRDKRTISNKRQRLQSMLRWAGVDPKIFPPKPKYDKKLPTIYSQPELAAMFKIANPYQRMVAAVGCAVWPVYAKIMARGCRIRSSNVLWMRLSGWCCGRVLSQKPNRLRIACASTFSATNGSGASSTWVPRLLTIQKVRSFCDALPDTDYSSARTPSEHGFSGISAQPLTVITSITCS